MTTAAFDLNIEEVLEDWEIQHALREVIANALDEQVLSHSGEIQITKDRLGDWHIRDFGRGLRIDHFTQKENPEKLRALAGVIGKFGVGLKDALATFYRRGVGVTIRSAYGTYSLRRMQKHGFEKIQTLHVEYDDKPNDMVGTEFVLSGVSDADMAKAKSLFLKFSGEVELDANVYGQIIQRPHAGPARIYILGVLANEEPNFLFSYNITSLTEGIKKRLNRERLNVSRTTYAERVRAILRNATSETVKNMLVEEVNKRAIGTQCDEMSWIEISQMALNLMHERRNVVYFTERELQAAPQVADTATRDGYQIVIVSEQQKARLNEQVQAGGPQVRTIEGYLNEYNASFQYRFVDPASLRGVERAVFAKTPRILSLAGVSPRQCPRVLISETLRVTVDDSNGVWDNSIPAIVIKRSALSSLADYAGVLLHEMAHATSGAPDVSRYFELTLTRYLGLAASAALS